jgi:hypothetical protein
MKALNLIRQSTYGPERLKQIYRAFDQAWEAIKPLVDDNPLAHEAARLTLANAILSVAKERPTDRPAAATAVLSKISKTPLEKSS